MNNDEPVRAACCGVEMTEEDYQSHNCPRDPRTEDPYHGMPVDLYESVLDPYYID